MGAAGRGGDRVDEGYLLKRPVRDGKSNLPAWARLVLELHARRGRLLSNVVAVPLFGNSLGVHLAIGSEPELEVFAIQVHLYILDCAGQIVNTAVDQGLQVIVDAVRHSEAAVVGLERHADEV